MNHRAFGPAVLLGLDARRRSHRVRATLLGPASLFRSVVALGVVMILCAVWGAGFAYVIAVLN